MGQEFKINDSGEIIREPQVKTKRSCWWPIISFFLFVIVCVLSYVVCEFYERIDFLYYDKNVLEDRVTELNEELQSKENEINELQEELSQIRNEGFAIRRIELGNNDYYGNTLTGYGRPLYSYEMRYLMPRIIYYATGTKNVTFRYKIFCPDGTLKCNSNYSDEFTGGSHNVTLYAGEKNNADLGGWGNNNNSIYQSGTYSIEIWYDGRCLKKQSFEIL